MYIISCINNPKVAASYRPPFVFIVFFKEFSNNIVDCSCLNCYISTKLLQIMCLINVHILEYQHAKCVCNLWTVHWFDRVSCEFSYILYYNNLSNFYRLFVEAFMFKSVWVSIYIYGNISCFSLRNTYFYMFGTIIMSNIVKNHCCWHFII